MGTSDDGPHTVPADGAEQPDSACVQSDWELALVLSERWAVPLQAHFTYRADDPYAVCLDFCLEPQNPVRWIFARHLLTTGLARSTGEADVRVRPGPDSALINLRLNSGGGDALFEIPVASLTAWLERTYQLVPPGHEHRFIDLDALIVHLLPERAPEENGGGRYEDPGPPRTSRERGGTRDGDPEDDGRGPASES